MHFLLTSAMLVFVALTFMLVLMAEQTCRAWAEYELRVEEPDNILWDYIQAVLHIRKRASSCFSCCSKADRRNKTDVAAMDFLTFRMEFVPLLMGKHFDTAEFPRKRNCDQSTSRFAHFNFAHYLSIRYGQPPASPLRSPVSPLLRLFHFISSFSSDSSSSSFSDSSDS